MDMVQRKSCLHATVFEVGAWGAVYIFSPTHEEKINTLGGRFTMKSSTVLQAPVSYPSLSRMIAWPTAL